MGALAEQEFDQVSFGGKFWRIAKPLVITLFVVFVAIVWAAVRWFGAPTAVVAQLLFIPVALAGVRFGPRGGAIVAVLSITMLWLAAMVVGGRDGIIDRWGTGVGDPWGIGVSDPWALTATSVVLLLVGVVVGESVRALIVFHQKALARWWDMELVEPTDLAEAAPLLSDDAVRRMVESGGFHSVFQPIYSLDHGRLLAAEALTRFDSEPPLPPSEWFRRAGELGLGTDLELAAVVRAVASAAGGKPGMVLTVNVSAATLMTDELVDIVDRAGRRILLELTELEPVSDYVGLRQAISRLRAAGALFAIDNVGASLTSLRHISRLSPDVIKLDAVLTNDERGDPLTRSLVNRLLRHGRDSGVLLIAEGIEEPEDLTRWRQRGVQAAQGYLLGRPGPLNFVDVIQFPSTGGKAGRRPRGAKARRHAEHVPQGDGGVSQSQLDDDVVWGLDLPPPPR